MPGGNDERPGRSTSKNDEEDEDESDCDEELMKKMIVKKSLKMMESQRQCRILGRPLQRPNLPIL